MNTNLSRPQFGSSMAKRLVWIIALAILIPGVISVPNAQAQPNPFIRIRPLADSIEGWNWIEGTSVTISIDDPDGEICESHSETKTVGVHHEEPLTYVLFELWGVCDLHAGHVVTMTDDEVVQTTKTLEIADVVVTAINDHEDFETITGTAPVGSTIQLHPHECSGECSVTAIADSAGDWTASYLGKQDLVPGMGGAATHSDGDGDVTWIDWQVPFTRMTVNFSHDWVDGQDWPVGASVDLTIDGPGEDDYSDTQVAVGDPDNPLIGRVGFDFWESYDVHPGYTVTLDDRATQITHVVYDLAMTGFDLTANSLSGTTSAPDGELWVTVYDDCWETIGVTSASGQWDAYFNGICNIGLGTEGDVSQPDGSGNTTLAMWRIPNPTIAAWPFGDRVEGFEWEVGSEVTLTIDDPGVEGPADYTASGVVGVADWNPEESYISFEFWDDPFSLDAGDVVTLSDGATTKVHIVTPLTLTGIDPVLDTATGNADPDSLVDAWTCNDFYCANRHLIAVGGTWTVDFANEGSGEDEKDTFDLIPGSWVDASQWDDDGDSTRVSASVPNPRIEASLTWDWMATHEFTSNATATFEVYESFGGALLPDFPQQVVTDEYGDSWLEGREFSADLQPGMHVVATDDVTSESRSLTLEAITLDVFDPVGDIVSGTTASAGPVWVDVGNEFEGCGMEVWPSGDSWTANFSGDPCYMDATADMWPSARVFDDDGDETVAELPPLPYFNVKPEENSIEAWDWPAGTTVFLEVDNPSTPLNPDYSASDVAAPPDWDPWRTWIGFDVSSMEGGIQPGHLVTMTDGITKTHTVTSLTVTQVDIAGDTVSGTAEVGTRVEVWTCYDQACAQRHVLADSLRDWTADFSIPGTEPDEQDIVDLVLGSWAEAAQPDDDDDATGVWVGLPNPHINVDFINDVVDGRNWPFGVEVTLTIDDGTGEPYSAIGTVGEDEWSTVVVFNLSGSFDVEPGNIVELTDGETNRSHVVFDLNITAVDTASNMVYGTGDNSREVWATVHEPCWGEIYIQPGDWDSWEADFTGICDIVEGSWGEAQQYDDQGNATLAPWQVPGFGRVYGSVQIDGEPLADSAVFLGIFGDEIERRHACTDAGGSFEFANVPYGPGLITITGSSPLDWGCGNMYFLDPDDIPLLNQAWDHYDIPFYLTWYSLGPENPEMQLQFDVQRAMATQTVMVEIDGPAPDLTAVRAFDTSQISLPIVPENYEEIFEGAEGWIANGSTGPPFGAGVAELRYPEWLGMLPDEILILVQYTEPNPGLVTEGMVIPGSSFSTGPGGFLIGPPMYFVDGYQEADVSIDIKPGNGQNPINLKSKGKIPVAVLSDSEFFASWVDPETVEFAGAPPTKWSWEDVDDDGDLDLMLHFKTQDFEDLHSESTNAILTGMTFGGVAIEGSDEVKIVPK